MAARNRTVQRYRSEVDRVPRKIRDEGRLDVNMVQVNSTKAKLCLQSADCYAKSWTRTVTKELRTVSTVQDVYGEIKFPASVRQWQQRPR